MYICSNDINRSTINTFIHHNTDKKKHFKIARNTIKIHQNKKIEVKTFPKINLEGKVRCTYGCMYIYTSALQRKCLSTVTSHTFHDVMHWNWNFCCKKAINTYGHICFPNRDEVKSYLMIFEKSWISDRKVWNLKFFNRF